MTPLLWLVVCFLLFPTFLFPVVVHSSSPASSSPSFHWPSGRSLRYHWLSLHSSSTQGASHTHLDTPDPPLYWFTSPASLTPSTLPSLVPPWAEAEVVLGQAGS